MYLYQKTSCPKNRAGKITALLLLLCGAALFIIAGATLEQYYSVIQALGVIMIGISVYIAVAYLLKEYTFSVTQSKSFNDEDASYAEKFDFIVTERKSNRTIKVCHFSMNDITDVRIVDPKNKKQIKAERRGRQCYTYNNEFAASRFLEIRATLDEESFSILVTFDEDLLKALNEFLKDD